MSRSFASGSLTATAKRVNGVIENKINPAAGVENAYCSSSAEAKRVIGFYNIFQLGCFYLVNSPVTVTTFRMGLVRYFFSEQMCAGPCMLLGEQLTTTEFFRVTPSAPLRGPTHIRSELLGLPEGSRRDSQSKPRHM